MTYKDIKRSLDLLVAVILVLVSIPLLFVCFVGCSITTKSLGLFMQERIGSNEKVFRLYKFKSMVDTTVNYDFQTSINDKRITKFGKFLRRTKLDELPQLFNVINGDMSFVGPRPDVEGYAELLDSHLKYLDKVKPGITSPASIYFKHEEIILSKVQNKKKFNDTIIWPIKAKMNRKYADNYTFIRDLIYILQTIGLLKSDKFQANE